MLIQIPRRRLSAAVFAVTVLAGAPHAQGQTAQAPAPAALSLPVPGIDSFHPVTTTIACGGNARPESMAALARAGFKSAISFRLDNEAEYDRPALERAAADAGIRFVALPFDREHPDRAVVDRFLSVIADPATAPAFLFCHTGQRAAMMWFTKRVRQDGWPTDRAMAEAASLGLTRPELKSFALEYVGTPAAARP